MADADWSLQDAKNKFSAVVDAALEGTPQRVMRRGRPAVVVLAAEEYERLRLCDRNKASNFSELLLDMPRDDGAFERTAVDLRDVGF